MRPYRSLWVPMGPNVSLLVYTRPYGSLSFLSKEKFFLAKKLN